MKQALKGILIVAAGTLLESVRSRILLVSLFFAVVLVGLSVAAASISLGEEGRLIVDVGLAAASALGSGIALSLAIASFAGELRQRTAYTVLARPIPRWAFVLGKHLGIVITIELLVLLMVGSTTLTLGDMARRCLARCGPACGSRSSRCSSSWRWRPCSRP